MNLDEAIKIVDPATRREALYRYDPEDREAVENEARHLVVTEIQCRYDPLTVYELRNMTGQPVYLKTLGEDFDDGWYIVGGIDKVRLHCLYLYSLLWLEHYGKTWLAYRYPPKEEE